MGDGQCQDCERCTASLVSRFGRGLAAVGTLGMTEVAIGIGDAFKRSCPTCKHPLGMHEGARIRLMNQAPQTVSVPMPVYVSMPPVPQPYMPPPQMYGPPPRQLYGPPQLPPPPPLFQGQFVWVSCTDGCWREGVISQFGVNGQICVEMRMGGFHWVDGNLLRPA